MGKVYRANIVYLCALIAGCSSLNGWLGADNSTNKSATGVGMAPGTKVAAPVNPGEDQIRFSENPNVGTFNERRYRRTTRKSIEEESDVSSRAGSLWNTEGPSSYLFTQNKLHREGDLLNIKVEGGAKNQIDTKIQVIKKLLSRIEVISSPALAGAPASSTENPGNGGDALTNREPAGVGSATKASSSGNSVGGLGSGKLAGTSSSGTEGDNLDAPISVESVPTRVSERLADGNYRVKGQQSFMIGKKEFRVIVTGLVRPEDFSDDGISSNKLLDPQWDVVSLRRSL